MWRRKNNNPPSPPPSPAPAADAPYNPPTDELRWKLHSYIDGMDEYMLRLVWSFLSIYYPNDPDLHRRR